MLVNKILSNFSFEMIFLITLFFLILFGFDDGLSYSGAESARGLIGKSKNDNVEINSPKGIKSYTIISVKYI